MGACVVAQMGRSFLDEAKSFTKQDGSIEDVVAKTDNKTFDMWDQIPWAQGLGKIFRYLREVPAILLPKNRGIQYVSINNFRANLQNSFLAVCYEQDLATEKCFCNKRYPVRYIIRNDTLESLVLIVVEPANKQIIISYRPTYSDKNWLTNLDFELIQFPGAPTGAESHRGFKDYVESLQAQAEVTMAKLLKMPKYKDFEIHTTGYSLGAAAAVVSIPAWAKFLCQNKFPHKFLAYSYAGPRPGNEAFAQYLASLKVPITRYSNREDLITHLPPRSLGYVHAGVEYHERETGANQTAVKLCSQAYDEDPSCGLNPHALLSNSRHYFPFNAYIPLPPYC
ncbi:hypothetical protein DSO57_1013709 [Entomophthora muscae]|uniref:Uncharacterized protein n=1 Tax=Entomophthora muscae TaxID=34485 RepID=A0ACC2TGH0_9FUNG|nr:hypothetical protein DSO57_1013709 [Entomophthora muscae]